MPLDLSVLAGNDPAGLLAEQQIKRRVALQLCPDASPDDDARAHAPAPHGSVAAADSSRFHAYRRDRRHELERLDAFDRARDALDDHAAFLARRAQSQAALDAKTAKNRARRARRRTPRDTPKTDAHG